MYPDQEIRVVDWAKGHFTCHPGVSTVAFGGGPSSVGNPSNELGFEGVGDSFQRAIAGFRLDGSAYVSCSIDISLNDDTQKESGVGWQLQLYAIALVKDRMAFSALLRDQLPAAHHPFNVG
jgi:hypothetical protein